MAQEGLLQIRHAFTAGGDLSSDIYKFITPAGALAGAGALGFPLVDKPTASGQPATVVLVGKAKITCNATLSAGDPVASDANGLAVAYAVGDYRLGFMLESAVANDVAQMLVDVGTVDTIS